MSKHQHTLKLTIGEFLVSYHLMEIDGEPWYDGTDMALLLGFNAPREAVFKYCLRHEALKNRPEGEGEPYWTFIIPEQDLLELVKNSPMSLEKLLAYGWVQAAVVPDTVARYEYYKSVNQSLETALDVAKELYHECRDSISKKSSKIRHKNLKPLS